MSDEYKPDKLTEAAEKEWLETWVAGPGEKRSKVLDVGTSAPELELLDCTGTSHRLSSFWSEGAALFMFWRHFGCGCGVDRASRLNDEYADYKAAGINPVIIGQGEPERAAAYKEEHKIDCPILCDPDFTAYSAFGLSNFGIEQLLYDAPEETWCHSKEIGMDFQKARRAINRPLVDNPWLSPGEFLVGQGGTIRVSYTYQYCENFPDPRIFLTAAKIF